PALPDKTADGQSRSMRGRLEQHRKNPVCAGCHARMDPLGFALENFDAVGRWRDLDAGTQIDASGVLPDGTTFKGPAAFRQVLLQQREEIVETLVERLMTYALGRGVEYYVMPAVRQVLRASQAEGTRWSAIVIAIATSEPFMMRMPVAAQAAEAR